MEIRSDRFQYYSLYLVSFANSAGLITITTLLPTYIDLLEPSGIAIGLFISGLTAAQAVAIVPLGWAGDRFDKRTVLLGTLLACAGAYTLFPFVETSAGFIAVRFLRTIRAPSSNANPAAPVPKTGMTIDSRSSSSAFPSEFIVVVRPSP